MTVLEDIGEYDGIRRVFFGRGLFFWLHKLLFVDALSYLSPALLPRKLADYGTTRWLAVDIDDVFGTQETQHMLETDAQVGLSAVCGDLGNSYISDGAPRNNGRRAHAFFLSFPYHQCRNCATKSKKARQLKHVLDVAGTHVDLQLVEIRDYGRSVFLPILFWRSRTRKERMVRWCIRLTRLTLVCEMIRYLLVQVRQNHKKSLFGLAARNRLSISSSSYFVSF